jgi:hypothetical protein
MHTHPILDRARKRLIPGQQNSRKCRRGIFHSERDFIRNDKKGGEGVHDISFSVATRAVDEIHTLYEYAHGFQNAILLLSEGAGMKI